MNRGYGYYFLSKTVGVAIDNIRTNIRRIVLMKMDNNLVEGKKGVVGVKQH